MDGKRTDDDQRCSLVVVQEVGGAWSWYPHGFDKFWVRLSQVEAVKVARAILDGASCAG